MSRIGKNPIIIPNLVNIFLCEKNITIKGPLGILNQKKNKFIDIKIDNKKIYIDRIYNNKKCKSLHGLYRSLINNMIIGVTSGFSTTLEVVGIGYRASNQENILDLNIGYSHNIIIVFPKEINVTTKSEKGNNPLIILRSNDKQLLGLVASKIRSLRKPEPYKGKGIRYLGETIRRKTGKSV